jgi:DNA-binding HxlR family transcriptional regulator
MTLDEKVWDFLLNARSFQTFSEIKKGVPIVHDEQLSRALRRLERDGFIIRHVISCKNKPSNAYLAINPDDPNLNVRLIDMHGWIFAAIQQSGERNSLVCHSVTLGELSNYFEQSENGELSIRWPLWILQLGSRVKYEDQSADEEDISGAK